MQQRTTENRYQNNSNQSKNNQNKNNQNYSYQNEDMVKLLLEALDDMRRHLRQEEKLRKELEQKLADQQGKVRFAEAVTSSGDSILVRELAGNLKQGGMDMGQKRLFEWLREHGYLYRLESGHNMPTQKSLDLGVIEIQKRTRMTSSGQMYVERTPKITSKGQNYFFQRLTADGGADA